MDKKTVSDIRPNVARLVGGCNRFAFDLYAKLAADTEGDLFFSPSSVSMALAMTLAGADGETAREMTEVLQISMPPDQLHESVRQLQADTRTGGVEFRVANRLWGQTGYQFLNEFLQTTDRCYGAKLEQVDFQTSPEEARQQINAWVEDQTAEKIKNLIAPGVLSEITRLVLTNAIYFLGCWEDEFDEEATKDGPFWISAEESISVPMMWQTDTFGYGEYDDFQLLEMPYRSQAFESRKVDNEDGGIGVMESVEIPGGGSDFTMCILLPREIDGLAALERQLSGLNFHKWTTTRGCEVNVSLPRFRIEASFQLDEQLQAMGMKLPFSIDEADFSKMSDDPDGLYLGSVIHKAFVDVNEKGTEAAAATAVVMYAGSAMDPEPPKEFRADHPFLFLIRDRKTQLIHFIGRMTSPQAASS